VRLDWLSAVCRSEGPFATVVLDVSHNTEDADHRAEVRRKDVQEQLAAQGAPPAVVERVDAALADADPPVGEAGRVLVVDEREVLVDVLLDASPRAEQVTWTALPDLLTVVDAVPEQVPTVVVRVDEEGGELLAPGDAHPESVAGRTKPVHKVRGGGWSHRSMQARVEETWKQNMAQVATLVDERVRAADARLLVIVGDTRSRARLLQALPERSATIADEVPHSGGEAPAEVVGAVGRRVDLLLSDERRAAFARYTELAGRAEGLAVTGLASVVAAARAQAIETLFVDPAGATEASIWGCPEPTVLGLTRAELTDLGAEAPREVPAVAALIRAAVCTDSGLVVLDNPDVVLGHDRLDDGSDTPESALLGGDTLTDGLGAVLRFPIGPA
jgi:Bacterial archaeo-eukaryotic release factor family 2